MTDLLPTDYQYFVAALKGPPGALEHWLKMQNETVLRETVLRICIEMYAHEKENAAQFNERRRQVEAQLDEWFRIRPAGASPA